VRELLAAKRRRVREVWISAEVDPAPILDEITDLAAANRVAVRHVPAGRLDGAARSEAPQGVLARAEPLQEADLDSLMAAKKGGSAPFLVALDGVTDPQNLGAVLRTAACAGATGAIVPRHRAAHVSPTAAKAAAGAIEYLPIAVVPGLPAALTRASEAGLWTVGLDAGAKTPLYDLQVATEPIVLVLGAEGRGLARLTRERCELVVRIPQVGPISSLNVSAAAALACFEVSRKRVQLPADG
jgi:23S rRNA (guanosine2251-2'-O)-methyltransferase